MPVDEHGQPLRNPRTRAEEDGKSDPLADQIDLARTMRHRLAEALDMMVRGPIRPPTSRVLAGFGDVLRVGVEAGILVPSSATDALDKK